MVLSSSISARRRWCRGRRFIEPLGSVLARDLQSVGQFRQPRSLNGANPITLPRPWVFSQACRSASRVVVLPVPAGADEHVQTPSGRRDRSHGVGLVRREEDLPSAVGHGDGR